MGMKLKRILMRMKMKIWMVMKKVTTMMMMTMIRKLRKTQMQKTQDPPVIKKLKRKSKIVRAAVKLERRKK